MVRKGFFKRKCLDPIILENIALCLLGQSAWVLAGRRLMGIQTVPRGRVGLEGMPCHPVGYSASLKAWERQEVTFSGLFAQSHDLYDSSSCLVCGKWTRRLNSGPRGKCLITQARHSGQVFRISAWKNQLVLVVW